MTYYLDCRRTALSRYHSALLDKARTAKVLSCDSRPMMTLAGPETFNLEIKEWGRRATNNNSSPIWNGLRGMQVGHSIRNNHDVDLRIEYVLNIRGARLESDIGRLISISDSPFLYSSVGLLCKDTNANIDPIDIVQDNIIKSGEHLFAIAFAEVDWGEWFSVYSTVTINATTVEQSKAAGGLRVGACPFRGGVRNRH